jgi:hypothetical protein
MGAVSLYYAWHKLWATYMRAILNCVVKEFRESDIANLLQADR